MAEYFSDKEGAVHFIQRWKSENGKPALFAKIRLHGSEKWIVDYHQRELGRSIEILENLNGEIDNIINR